MFSRSKQTGLVACVTAMLLACSESVAPDVSHTTEMRSLTTCTVSDCRPVASRNIGSTLVRLTGAIPTPCAASAVLAATATSQGGTLTVVVSDNGGVRACLPTGSPLPFEVLIRSVPSSVGTMVLRGASPQADQTLQISTTSAAPN